MFNADQGLKTIFTKRLINSYLFLITVFVFILTLAGSLEIAAQTMPGMPAIPVASPTPYMQPVSPVSTGQPNSLTSGTAFSPTTNYLKNSAAFRQEIARMEITVSRAGKSPMSITQVPRVQKDDVLKVRLLDEAVGGIKPDQSNWDWTFLVAFVNPNRNLDKQKSVSEEIQFRKRGWYREYAFVVPYDSQPIFFLYPKPKYRNRILNLINKKYEEVQKLGDKTIELAGAYAQINSFLNELQYVLLQTQSSRYGSFVTYPKPVTVRDARTGKTTVIEPEPIYNYNAFLEQTVERIARSFNIQLPQCWQSSNGAINYGSSFGSSYNSGNYTSGTTGSQNSFGYAVSSDLVGRAQCIAKNVRIEDFDISVANMLKQGGIFAVTQLRDRYPQLAYWINIAATALDFIVKAFQKSPLRIVPTIISTNNNNSSNNFSNTSSNNQSSIALQQTPVKISLYAESQPSEHGFVTAYPLVVHKWQQEPDPEVISLYPPELAEPCLHAGMNILKNTNLTEDFSVDTFTKDFKLVMNGSNGFKKEFPLRKNLGVGGWELNLTKEDINSFPKVQMTIESFITGTRGFNEIKSPMFNLPISLGGTYEIKPESQKAFAVGGKRTVTLRNSLGNCKCLQAVIYKPSFAGQFVFEANAKDPKNQLQFSVDGKEVSFEIDASSFQPGAGTLEIKTYGGETANLNLKLYPLPPNITNFKISAGDREGTLTGDRLEQVQFVKINGKKAKLQSSKGPNERIAIFEETSFKQPGGNISLELGLEDDRAYQTPITFKTGLSRPSITANEANEVEVVFIKDSGSKRAPTQNSLLNLSKYPVIPIDVNEITVELQNTLTDYDFKTENIQIETRIEKSQTSTNELPKVSFEVLDWKALRVSFTLSEQVQKLLGGRRLQFRIRDKERGDSDWYTIKQTFIRVPNILSVKCTNEMNNQCELKGEGIDYIQQVSVDGGQTWFPQETAGLIVQPTADGQKAALIPLLSNKKMLQIKLRDFPKTEGLIVSEFVFSNTVKATKKATQSVASPTTPNQGPPNQSPIINQNKVPNHNQIPKSAPNQSNSNLGQPISQQPNMNQKPND